MSDQFQDEDIEFDFFEDVETGEQQPTPEEPRSRPPGGGRPHRPSGPGLTPTTRLIGLIIFAIVIVVLLVFLVMSCSGSGKKSKFESYMRNVGVVATDSEQIGRDLTKALTKPGIKPNELADEIDGLAQQQQQGVANAEGIKPPGSLQQEDQGLLEALRFRVGGLRGLADVFRRTAGSKDEADAALRLSRQAQRLVASDVIWNDVFRKPSIRELRTEQIKGVPVPDSNFVQDPNFGSPSFWVPVFQRVNGAATGGSTVGLHGTGIVETRALPSGNVLKTDVENIVTAGTDLGFSVTIEDTGDAQEVQIKVTLTIQQQPSPITATQTIDSINPGEQKTVVFRNLGQVQFATKTTVKVDVQPVQGEANTDNNSAEYPVIFSLG